MPRRKEIQPHERTSLAKQLALDGWPCLCICGCPKRHWHEVDIRAWVENANKED